MSYSTSTDNFTVKKVNAQIIDKTVQIEYCNGDGGKRLVDLCWHENFGLVNVSFYDGERENELVFAEDFSLETAVKLRDELSGLIAAEKLNKELSRRA